MPVRWRFLRHPRRTVLTVLNGGRRLVGLAPRPDLPRILAPPPVTSLASYVEERHGAGPLPLLRESLELVARYAADDAAFERSPDLPALLAKVRRLAGAAAPATDAPDVSIIIPVHNALVCTLTCLAALLDLPTGFRYEIIIADDASRPAGQAVLREIGGPVRHVAQKRNLGFIRNCNAAAEAARGRYLVFLNNDTFVLPGWLDALIATLQADLTIGLVGSRLLNDDGTLQEAGGIIWQDGSGWNYGRGQDPRIPAAGFVRDVDFCSGASLAIARSLWRKLGGFDTRYAPAYFEDSDLAFRVRASGRRVVYQPFSEVVHHEGCSHGRDLTSGGKAWQARNVSLFTARWRETLLAGHFPNGESGFLARDRSRGVPHVLFVDHYVPQWDQDAGSRTIFDFMRTFLERGFRVTLWPANQYYDREYVERLQRMGVEVIYAVPGALDMGAWLREAGASLGYVLLSRPEVAATFLPVVRANSAASVLFYGHDLHWKRLEMEFDTTGDPGLPRSIAEMRKLERSLWEAVDAVCYPSEAECAVVRSEVSVPAIALPMAAFDAAPQESAGESARAGRHVMFIGGFGHKPNVDGILWFMAEVWPRLVARDPAFRITIAGSHPPPEVLALAGDAVTVTGRISAVDLAALYRHASVAIAPLRYGAGVKGKVIEAFASGIPMVTTSVGVQGIADPVDLAFVADDAGAFAAAVLSAEDDSRCAAGKVARARAFIRDSYSTAAIARQLSGVVPDLNNKTGSINQEKK